MTQQTALSDDGITSIPKAHYDTHKPVYDYIAGRLECMRDAFTDSEKRAELLRHSTEYAIISVQTNVELHEPAFLETRGLTEQSEIADTLSDYVVTYHNNKARYITENRETVDFESLSEKLLSGNVNEVHAEIRDQCLGLGSAKSAFTLAMLGFTEKLCVDSHTANMAGMDRYASSDMNIEQYEKLHKEIRDTFPELSSVTKPFIQQWIMFDADRGSVELHDPWFGWVSEVIDIDLF